jgi:hypothetical protein
MVDFIWFAIVNALAILVIVVPWVFFIGILTRWVRQGGWRGHSVWAVVTSLLILVIGFLLLYLLLLYLIDTVYQPAVLSGVGWW